MTRAEIQYTLDLVRMFAVDCEDALDQLDREDAQATEYWCMDQRMGIALSNTAPQTGQPGKMSAGSAATGQLRRASMDLTRQLARLRGRS